MTTEQLELVRDQLADQYGLATLHITAGWADITVEANNPLFVVRFIRDASGYPWKYSGYSSDPIAEYLDKLVSEATGEQI